MKEIILSRGEISIIDDEDFDHLSKRKWNCIRGYAQGKKYENGKETSIRMHRLIMNAKSGQLVDHINFNKLDNRKCNLRIATHAENSRHRRPRMGAKYKCVWFDKARKKYEVRIKINGKHIFGGRFTNEIDAAIRYNELAKKLHGEFAYLNNVL